MDPASPVRDEPGPLPCLWGSERLRPSDWRLSAKRMWGCNPAIKTGMSRDVTPGCEH